MQGSVFNIFCSLIAGGRDNLATLPIERGWCMRVRCVRAQSSFSAFSMGPLSETGAQLRLLSRERTGPVLSCGKRSRPALLPPLRLQACQGS